MALSAIRAEATALTGSLQLVALRAQGLTRALPHFFFRQAVGGSRRGFTFFAVTYLQNASPRAAPPPVAPASRSFPGLIPGPREEALGSRVHSPQPIYLVPITCFEDNPCQQRGQKRSHPSPATGGQGLPFQTNLLSLGVVATLGCSHPPTWRHQRPA